MHESSFHLCLSKQVKMKSIGLVDGPIILAASVYILFQSPDQYLYLVERNSLT